MTRSALPITCVTDIFWPLATKTGGEECLGFATDQNSDRRRGFAQIELNLCTIYKTNIINYPTYVTEITGSSVAGKLGGKY